MTKIVSKAEYNRIAANNRQGSLMCGVLAGTFLAMTGLFSGLAYLDMQNEEKPGDLSYERTRQHCLISAAEDRIRTQVELGLPGVIVAVDAGNKEVANCIAKNTSPEQKKENAVMGIGAAGIPTLLFSGVGIYCIRRNRRELSGYSVRREEPRGP